jgi:aspartate kinase
MPHYQKNKLIYNITLMQVFKFGGASVKDAEGVKNLAKIVQRYPSTHLLIVISAMGKMTNKLEELTWAYVKGDEKAHQLFDEIKAFHFDIISTLFEDQNNPIYDDVANTFVEIEWLLEEQASDSADYLYDQIVSIGEVVSTKIVAAYLNLAGTFTIWTDARNYIKTDNNYREANVIWDKTEQEIQKHLPTFLDKGIVVTQGFIGGTSENFTSTLGREGSDYSAAIFCACLNAESMTIWKDVPGVLNADPKWFDETEKIPQLSYHDAIELTYYGATVIHPKTIKPIQNKGIPLYVRSFIEPEAEGTAITGVASPLPVPSFIFKVNQVLISIFPKDFSFIIEENLSQIFNILHKNKVKVNTMLNSAISFSVSVDNDDAKIEQLIKDLSETFKVKYNKGLELVTIRYYNQQTIDRVIINKDVLLEVKSRHTCQIVMKNKATPNP